MNNDFIDIMHDRLSQHEMIEPSGLWQDIENSLDSRGTHKKKGLVASRSAIYKSVAGVAAAALVAMVMWTTLKDDSNTPSEETRPTLSATTPASAPAPTSSVETEPTSIATAPAPSPSVGTRQAMSVNKPTTSHAKQLANNSPSIKTRPASTANEPANAPSVVTRRASISTIEETIISPAKEQPSTQPQAPAKENLALNDADTTTNQVDTTLTIPYEPAQQLPQLWAFTESTRKNDRKPEFALSYNGYLGSAGSENFKDLEDYLPGWAPENSSPDPENPDNYETVHVDENEQIVPVRVGLEVWYPIGEKWRIGSGLVYTHLSRKKTTTYTTVTESSWRQKSETASYLGIPVEVSRILWNRRRWSFYAGAGAMIEFNLKSKLRERTDTELFNMKDYRDRRPQFSAIGRLGLQYNVADRVGIYFEPGGSYYFNNGADNNIYMAHPFRFDINLGIKINLGK